MGGGGKGGTSTTQVSIPPEVLARYNAVNARAEQVAQTPFQAYGGEFVAPMNTVQQQGVGQTQQYAQAAQPYYNTAAGMTTAAAQAVQPIYSAAEMQTLGASQPLSGQQIAQYQSPYTQAVASPVLRALQQQQGIDLAKQQAQQIQTGAFGGDRSGLSRAMLQGQQELAQAQAIAPIYQQAYQNALQTAQQQQQIGLSGAQQLAGIGGQQLSGQLTAGQQLAGIGTGAQQAGLQGAQAVIGAGTLGQQTQQALDTAQYQQFLQERGYPFQTAQFLANIAEGTGALSGSTTTTTQPTSFFSDERLKTDIKKIATAKNGLPIYSFKYKDDPKTTHIGFIAQDVEKKHPEAVGLSGGYKTVDYGKALREARAYGGGILPISMGGGVWPSNVREEFAAGGSSMDDIVAMQARMYGMGGDQGGAGQSSAILPYVNKQKAGLGIPNVGRDPYRRLLTGSTPSQQQQYGFRQAMGDISSAGSAASTLSSGWDKLTGKDKPKPSDGGVKPAATTGTDQPQSQAASPPPAQTDVPADKSWWEFWKAHGGGVMPRIHASSGSYIDPYKPATSESMIPEDVMEESESTKDKAEGQAIKPDGSRGSGSGGGGGGLGSALGAASSLVNVGKGVGSFMSWLPTLFLNDGGRVRYYNGGLVPRQGFANPAPSGAVAQSDQPVNYGADDEHPADKIFHSRVIPQESGGKQFDAQGRPLTSSAGALGMAQIMPQTGPEAARLAGLEWDPTKLATDPDYNLKSGRAYFRKQWDDFGGDEQKALAAYNAGPGRLSSAIQKAGEGGDYRSLLPAETQKYIGYAGQQKLPGQQMVEGGLGAAKDLAARMVPADYRGRETVVVNPKTGEERPREWGDFLTSRDFILPLMAGLGTMASSPSRYLGAAILQGLGGAATAYQGVQNQQLARDEAMARAQETLAKLPAQVPEYEKGKLKVESKEQSFGPSLKAGPAPVGGVKPPPTADEAAGAAPIAPQAPSAPVIVQPTPKSMNAATTEIRETLPMSPSDKAGRDARIQAILNDQLRAKTQAEQGTSLINQLTVPLASLSAGEQIAPGPLSQPISTLVNYWNNIANQFKFPDEFKIDPTAASDIQVARKAATLLAGARAEDIGQTAYNALKTMANATANPEMNREAAAEIMAQAYIDKQRAIDEAIYTQKYSKANPALGMAGESAATEFRNTPGFTTADEMKAKAALKDLILQSTKETDDSGKTVKKSLLGYMLGLEKGTHAGKISPQTVDELFYKQYGVPNISRYFLNTTR